MPTRWTLNTCDCIVIISGTDGETFVNWEQKCNEHKDLNDQALLDTILTHHRQYADQVGDTARQKADHATDRATEKARIRATGAPVRNTS